MTKTKLEIDYNRKQIYLQYYANKFENLHKMSNYLKNIN